MYLGKSFDDYLSSSNEIGFVEVLKFPLVGVSGLPNAFIGEVVVFSSNSLGMVFSLEEETALVLLLGEFPISVGEKVTRTGKLLQVMAGSSLLGGAFNPLGKEIFGRYLPLDEMSIMDVFAEPLDFSSRTHIKDPLETGVSIVDL
ncbi:MAG TPA: hypothetical protein PLT50_02520, partial [bacterium]|nr:hypothetical protein [bacterium]